MRDLRGIAAALKTPTLEIPIMQAHLRTVAERSMVPAARALPQASIRTVTVERARTASTPGPAGPMPDRTGAAAAQPARGKNRSRWRLNRDREQRGVRPAVEDAHRAARATRPASPAASAPQFRSRRRMPPIAVHHLLRTRVHHLKVVAPLGAPAATSSAARPADRTVDRRRWAWVTNASPTSCGGTRRSRLAAAGAMEQTLDR